MDLYLVLRPLFLLRCTLVFACLVQPWRLTALILSMIIEFAIATRHCMDDNTVSPPCDILLCLELTKPRLRLSRAIGCSEGNDHIGLFQKSNLCFLYCVIDTSSGSRLAGFVHWMALSDSDAHRKWLSRCQCRSHRLREIRCSKDTASINERLQLTFGGANDQVFGEYPWM